MDPGGPCRKAGLRRAGGVGVGPGYTQGHLPRICLGWDKSSSVHSCLHLSIHWTCSRPHSFSAYPALLWVPGPCCYGFAHSGGHRELVLGWGGGMSGQRSRKASLRKWHLISGASQTEGQQGDPVGTGMHARKGAGEAAGPPRRGWSNLDFKRRLRLGSEPGDGGVVLVMVEGSRRP